MEVYSGKYKMNQLFEQSFRNTQSKFCREGANFRRTLKTFQKDPDLGGTTLHHYQIGAVLAVKNMLDSDPSSVTKPSLIVAPTGAGKSGMIVMLPYILESKKVLILTPSAIISNQLAEAFGCRQDKKNCFFLDAGICDNVDWLSSFLEDVKVISNSRDAMEKAMGNLVIVNAQKFGGKSKATLSMKYRDEVTIKNVETFFAQFDTLIVDEAHHYPCATWKQIVDEFKKKSKGLRKKIVFLTATPFNVDKKGNRVHVLGSDRTAFTISKDMCIGSSIRRLEFDMNREDDGNYVHDINEILEEQQETEDRFVPQAMVLAKGREEVFKIVEELNDEFGENYAVAISGETKKIAEGLRAFTEGKYRVAVTCKVGLEGYDNTKVTLCVILRKITTGRIMFSQFVGRCMRIRRGLRQIKGKDRSDRNVGKVISYEVYEQDKLRREYEEMDDYIASRDPIDEED